MINLFFRHRNLIFTLNFFMALLVLDSAYMLIKYNDKYWVRWHWQTTADNDSGEKTNKKRLNMTNTLLHKWLPYSKLSYAAWVSKYKKNVFLTACQWFKAFFKKQYLTPLTQFWPMFPWWTLGYHPPPTPPPPPPQKHHPLFLANTLPL